MYHESHCDVLCCVVEVQYEMIYFLENENLKRETVLVRINHQTRTGTGLPMGVLLASTSIETSFCILAAVELGLVWNVIFKSFLPLGHPSVGMYNSSIGNANREVDDNRAPCHDSRSFRLGGRRRTGMPSFRQTSKTSLRTVPSRIPSCAVWTLPSMMA